VNIVNLFEVDKYSNLSSPVHRVNPVTSLVSYLLFVGLVAVAPQRSFVPLFVALLTLCCVALASRVPVRFLIKRSAVVIPFVGAIVGINLLARGASAMFRHHQGSLAFDFAVVRPFAYVVLKAFVCVLGTALLITVTGTTNLLRAMGRIGVPRDLTAVACFLSRYVSVAMEELFCMRRARDSRRAGKLRAISELKTTGALVGVLFIRSYKRAERVHAAMCSRGFEGVMVTPPGPLPPGPESPGLRFTGNDLAFAAFLLIPLVLSFFV